jgi:hypothetical protein
MRGKRNKLREKKKTTARKTEHIARETERKCERNRIEMREKRNSLVPSLLKFFQN